jgi:hypothetical protein
MFTIDGRYNGGKGRGVTFWWAEEVSAWNRVTYTAEAVINISLAARLMVRNRATVR